MLQHLTLIAAAAVMAISFATVAANVVNTQMAKVNAALEVASIQR